MADNTIEEKKKITSGESNLTKIQSFFANIGLDLLHLTIIVFTGSIMLYNCKVAQSNIMPTELDCSPFKGEILPNLQEIPINMNVVKTADDIKSAKIVFPTEENMNTIKNGILGIDWIRRLLEPEVKTPANSNIDEIPKPSILLAYFLFILQNLIQMNNVVVNKVYETINKNCSESVIVFIMPYIVFFILLGMIIFNTIYSWWLWFSKAEVFFYKGKYTPADSNKLKFQWQKPGKDQSIIWLCITLVLLFWAFLFLGSWLILPCLVIFSAFISLLTPFFMTAKKSGDEKSKYNFFNALKDVVKYKMSVIMYIISFFVITEAYKTQGVVEALFAIFACIFIYFFYPETYKPIGDMNKLTSTLVDYTQATKTCGN
jgi:glycosyltransferase involved in cell wall biosynthesis